MGELSRRRFVQGAATALGGLAVPDLLRDPYRPWGRVPPVAASVRIRGRVLASGRGVARAGLSDGLTVVSTDAEGHFELVSDQSRRFLSLSPPSGYELPVSPTGTLQLFQPIAPDPRGEMASMFQLVPLREADEDHAFLLLADPQTQDHEETGRLHAETVPDVQRVARSLGGIPLFGVADGEIMYDDLSLYPEWEAAVKTMGIPFAQVVGNHDLDLKEPTDAGAPLPSVAASDPATTLSTAGGSTTCF